MENALVPKTGIGQRASQSGRQLLRINSIVLRPCNTSILCPTRTAFLGLKNSCGATVLDSTRPFKKLCGSNITLRLVHGKFRTIKSISGPLKCLNWRFFLRLAAAGPRNFLKCDCAKKSGANFNPRSTQTILQEVGIRLPSFTMSCGLELLHVGPLTVSMEPARSFFRTTFTKRIRAQGGPPPLTRV